MKKDCLTGFLDTVFVINGEMIAHNGEDSFAYSFADSNGFMGVFDGCGGIGSRKYEEYERKTGAYLASHLIALETMDWFGSFQARGLTVSTNTTAEICSELCSRYSARLKLADSKTSGAMIKGSLTKNFPTTASLILFSYAEKKLNASFVWAGDSRGFVLTTQGLSQITRDDIDEGEDALSNLSNDGRLTNVVSAVGDFKLNCRQITCSGPAVFVTATDGCFAYFSTPMEFEYMLISTLENAENIHDWKKRLHAYILEYTGDDHTMCVAVCGYRNFRTLKRAYAERLKYIETEYMSKLDGISEKEKIALWNHYRATYYRGGDE